VDNWVFLINFNFEVLFSLALFFNKLNILSPGSKKTEFLNFLATSKEISPAPAPISK
jgi:hypothetical protein